jgi:hypothetical protein
MARTKTKNDPAIREKKQVHTRRRGNRCSDTQGGRFYHATRRKNVRNHASRERPDSALLHPPSSPHQPPVPRDGKDVGDIFCASSGGKRMRFLHEKPGHSMRTRQKMGKEDAIALFS